MILYLGVTTVWGNGLKGGIVRNVENHCSWDKNLWGHHYTEMTEMIKVKLPEK